MLLSLLPQASGLTAFSYTNFTVQLFLNHKNRHIYSVGICRASSPERPLLPVITTGTREVTLTSNDDASGNEDSMVSSSAALAAAIRAASTSPVEFVHKIEKINGKSKSLVLPSLDFQRLCIEQLDLFRRIVDTDAVLSVYVRPADSYVMDRLELRRITIYPVSHDTDVIVLVGNFSMPAGLRVAESEISRQQVQVFPQLGAVVFPMVTHPFVVGFLVAEFSGSYLESQAQHGNIETIPQEFPDPSCTMPMFSNEQKLNAINITRSLAMGYVMDQKTMLLQQSSWQNNIRMSNLVEQIRGSLSSIQTLSKMLSIHLKRTEISHDIVEDILAQGDHMKDSLQQLQDAVYLTKGNIMNYNNEMLKKGQPSIERHFGSSSRLPLGSSVENSTTNALGYIEQLTGSSISKDLEFPMPPLALAPSHKEGIRKPCKISDVLQDLVGAVTPLAHKQRRHIELRDLSKSLEVAVEEPALRQALSNLIEGALLRINIDGKIAILSTGAPAGGALVIIDDDGPDMLYMTQMHSLAPFGPDLLSDGKLEDNMTWNFIAGLTVARDILENYGCIVRVISPRKPDAPLGAGGTRLELWLPLPYPSDTQSSSSLQTI